MERSKAGPAVHGHVRAVSITLAHGQVEDLRELASTRMTSVSHVVREMVQEGVRREREKRTSGEQR